MSNNSLWSIELEVKALRSILTPKSPYAQDLFGALKPEHFYSRTTQEIHKRLCEVMAAGQTDLPSFDLFIEDQQIPEGIRQAAQSDFAGIGPVEAPGDYDYLIAQLGHYAKARALYRATQGAAKKLLEDPTALRPELLREMTDQLGSLLMEIDSEGDTASQVTLGIGYNAAAEDSFHRVMYGDISAELIPMGYKSFDSRTGGFRRSNLVIIAANSGGGKSLMAVNIMVRQYLMGHNVVLISYEMTEDEVLIRLLSNISEVDMTKIALRKYDTPEEASRVEYAYREFLLHGKNKNCHFTIICPKSETTVTEIGFKVKALKPTTVILDYINLLTTTSDKAESMWQALSEISKESKLLANKLHCVVFLLAQLDNTFNLKYSKAIMDHANFVMGWVRDEESKSTRLINVKQLKARNAPLYDFTLLERFNIAQFRDEGESDRTSWPGAREVDDFYLKCEQEGLMGKRSIAKVAVTASSSYTQPQIAAAVIDAELVPEPVSDPVLPVAAKKLKPKTKDLLKAVDYSSDLS